MIKPLNNNCLVELIDDYQGIIRDNQQEQVQKGVLRECLLTSWHLTASAGFDLGPQIMEVKGLMDKLTGKTVYWEEYSDTGKKFEVDGKRYSLIPFYRIIGYEE